MTGREVFKIWAPVEGKWSGWCRPVPFIWMDETPRGNNFYNFTVSPIDYISEPSADTAVIVDLPGHESVREGLALMRIGFRPVPLYNGTKEQEGAMALVDNQVIAQALLWGTAAFEENRLASDAPPAFLLDSNRMHRFKMSPSAFDNSWDIYDQDLPSAEYFLENGINKIVVRGEKIQKDLKKILFKFQKKGMTILFTDGYRAPGKVMIKHGKIRW